MGLMDLISLIGPMIIKTSEIKQKTRYNHV